MPNIPENVLAIARDWDFKNRHGIEHSNGRLPPPEDVEEFLRGIVELPEPLKLSETPPTVRALFMKIREVYLEWAGERAAT